MDNIHWRKVVLLYSKNKKIVIEETASCFIFRGTGDVKDALINWSSFDAKEAQTWLRRRSSACSLNRKPPVLMVD